MKVICEGCKNEIEVEPFIYEGRIAVKYIPQSLKEVCTAKANVKFFCSLCGTLHHYKDIEKELSEIEITSLVEGVISHYNRLRMAEKELQNER